MSPTTRSSRRTRKSPRRSGRTKRNSDASRRGPVSVLVGLGSNLGDPPSRIEAALAALAEIAPLLRVSSLYASDPVGHAAQPDFCNAAAMIRWGGSPRQLLAATRRLERRLGRRATFPGGPREIDIDILDFAGLVRDSPDPVLPHPRLAGRRFALAPIAEIAPEWRHPVTGQTARGMMRKLPRTPGARKVRGKRDSSDM
jgi:2-amino-4-hydroxy-6-hydroxymethyldihydropteridine diphosphokinase